MTSALVDKYQKKIREANQTRIRVEELYSRRELLERDVLAVYEGLFLRAVVGFEDLLEQVFFTVLLGKTSKRNWGSRIKGSNPVLRKCVMEEKDYLSWLPIQQTVKRAKTYLCSGRPFSEIDVSQKNNLAQVLTIRHAIAHSSKSALQKFRSNVIGSTNIPRHERNPARFLRGFGNANITRYEVYVQNLGGIANCFRSS